MDLAIFFTGLGMVLLRSYGIARPRQWVEWAERRFVDSRLLRGIGAILLIAALAFWSLAHERTPLLVLSLALWTAAGLLLAFFQNHLRMLILATAESSDSRIRVASAAWAAAGLFWMAGAFF